MSFDPSLQHVGAIPLTLLRRYLAASNWRVEEPTKRAAVIHDSAVARALLSGRTSGHRDFDVWVLRDRDYEPVEVLVPEREDVSDYYDRVLRVVQTLADLGDSSREEIANDVRSVGYDLLRSRVPSRFILDESIYLEVARGYVLGIRDVLAAAATTEISPAPFFLRLKKDAVDFADQCRFGHTFHGSFGFSLESPVAANTQPTFNDIEQSPPFERRVIERILIGLQSTQSAVDQDDLEPLTSSATTGFNANVCEQFARLVEKTSFSEMIFDFRLSPEWKSSNIKKGASFVVGPRHVEAFRLAAKILRTAVKPRSESVSGRINKLSSDVDPSDLLNVDGDREITIQWSDENIVVKTVLAPSEYLKAVEAHGAGKRVVVSGTLERRGRSWFLSEPTNFAVI